MGELKVYPIYEHDLDRLAQGEPTGLLLNFALFLLPISLTLLVALLTTTISSDRLYYTFVCVASITFISGLVLLLLWRRLHKNSKSLAAEIRSRMPPPPATMEQAQQ